MLLVKNGMIYTMTEKEPFLGDILAENGKIVKIGKDLPVPEGCRVVDASGLRVYPGFVDAHCHLGLDGYGIGFEGQDYNEMNDIVAPELQAIDSIYPQDETLHMAAEAGVTCVGTGPGSANVLGGTFAAIKTVGVRVDDMVVKKAVAMKCAFGENPKRVYKDKNNYARMSTASKLRVMLRKAQEYQARLQAAGEDVLRRPAYDPKLEALLPVINREIPLKAHAHRLDDIFTSIRIAKEFGVKLTLEHCTEGHLAPEEIAKEGFPAAVGPSLTHASKFELRNKTFATPGILCRAGVQVSIITDSPVIPEQYLPLCAGLAVKAGMDPYEAMKAITINPAKHLGIEDRVGSLEAGKDADMVLADGCPMEVSTRICRVFINGEEVEKGSHEAGK